MMNCLRWIKRSVNNRQLFRDGDAVAWVADVPDSSDKYVALFNTHDQTGDGQTVTVQLKDLGMTGATVRDLWAHKDLDAVTGTLALELAPHTARLLRLSRQK